MNICFVFRSRFIVLNPSADLAVVSMGILGKCGSNSLQLMVKII